MNSLYKNGPGVDKWEDYEILKLIKNCFLSL